jgi:hypothetical protein
MDPEAQSLWHEAAAASDEVAAIIDRIPGLTVTGMETRNELERAAALLKAVAVILGRTERREGARYAPVNRSILGPDPCPERPQPLGGTTWPRISPAGCSFVCRFTYHFPAEKSLACSGVSVACPVMGLSAGLPCLVSQTCTPAFSPLPAGPWKWAMVTGPVNPL